MPLMSVTLEVLKLSGWLNADANCRESQGGHTVRDDVRAGRREVADVHGKRRAWGGLGCRYGAGHGEERTANMEFMLVTLEVSKLSGWLNAEANCRESKGRHNVRGEVRAEAGGGGGRSRCTQRVGEGSTVDGEQEERTKNIWLMSVTPEVSQLEMFASKPFKSWMR